MSNIPMMSKTCHYGVISTGVTGTGTRHPNEWKGIITMVNDQKVKKKKSKQYEKYTPGLCTKALEKYKSEEEDLSMVLLQVMYVHFFL